jgi:hypothetical protein
MSLTQIGTVQPMSPAARPRNVIPPSKLRRVVEVSEKALPWATIAGVAVTMVSSLLVAFAFLAGAMTTPKDIEALRQENHAIHTEVQTLREEFQQSAITGLRPQDVNNHLSAIDHRFDVDEDRLRLDEERLTRMDVLLGLTDKVTRGK